MYHPGLPQPTPWGARGAADDGQISVVPGGRSGSPRTRPAMAGRHGAGLGAGAPWAVGDAEQRSAVTGAVTRAAGSERTRASSVRAEPLEHDGPGSSAELQHSPEPRAPYPGGQNLRSGETGGSQPALLRSRAGSESG